MLGIADKPCIGRSAYTGASDDRLSVNTVTFAGRAQNQDGYGHQAPTRPNRGEPEFMDEWHHEPEWLPWASHERAIQDFGLGGRSVFS